MNIDCIQEYYVYYYNCILHNIIDMCNACMSTFNFYRTTSEYIKFCLVKLSKIEFILYTYNTRIIMNVSQ